MLDVIAILVELTILFALIKSSQTLEAGHKRLQEGLEELRRLQTSRVGRMAQQRSTGSVTLPPKARTTRRDSDDLPLTSRVGRVNHARRYPADEEE